MSEQRLHDVGVFLRTAHIAPSGGVGHARSRLRPWRELLDDAGIAHTGRQHQAASLQRAVRAFGFAPAASSVRTMAALPFWQAVQSGVTPDRSPRSHRRGPYQLAGGLDIVAVAGPMQGRRAIRFGALTTLSEIRRAPRRSWF